MRSQANITVTPRGISVRFSSHNFYAIVKRWKITFPQAQFNTKHKVWELPAANIEQVKQFCDEHFWHIKVNSAPQTSQESRQSSLFN